MAYAWSLTTPLHCWIFSRISPLRPLQRSYPAAIVYAAEVERRLLHALKSGIFILSIPVQAIIPQTQVCLFKQRLSIKPYVSFSLFLTLLVLQSSGNGLNIHYSRFNFHVLDCCQWLRMRDNLEIQECTLNELNYRYYTCALIVTFNFQQLHAIANANRIHSLQNLLNRKLTVVAEVYWETYSKHITRNWEEKRYKKINFYPANKKGTIKRKRRTFGHM